MTLTIHLHLVPRLKMRGVTPPLRNTPSWSSAYLGTGTTSPFLLITDLVCNRYTYLLYELRMIYSSPVQWVPGALFLGIKWSRREADHSPPSSAEVNE